MPSSVYVLGSVLFLLVSFGLGGEPKSNGKF